MQLKYCHRLQIIPATATTDISRLTSSEEDLKSKQAFLLSLYSTNTSNLSIQTGSIKGRTKEKEPFFSSGKRLLNIPDVPPKLPSVSGPSSRSGSRDSNPRGSKQYQQPYTQVHNNLNSKKDPSELLTMSQLKDKQRNAYPSGPSKPDGYSKNILEKSPPNKQSTKNGSKSSVSGIGQGGGFRIVGEDPSVRSQTIYIPEKEKRKNQIRNNKEIVQKSTGKRSTPQKVGVDSREERDDFLLDLSGQHLDKIVFDNSSEYRHLYQNNHQFSNLQLLCVLILRNNQLSNFGELNLTKMNCLTDLDLAHNDFVGRWTTIRKYT
jgi:hypothetical protein